MKVDIKKISLFFEELMPASDEEQGVYWFKTFRSDGLIIIFAFSIYEAYADIIIQNTSKIDIASFGLENCSEIKILDEIHKHLEVSHINTNKKCLLSILSSPILEYKE